MPFISTESVEARIHYVKGKIAELDYKLDTLRAGVEWGNTYHEREGYKKELKTLQSQINHHEKL